MKSKVLRKRKKVSGFTLVELIIVVAIFSAIAVGALAMIRPAMNIYNQTSAQEEAGAAVNNISRYIQDNLRYADRVNVYQGNGITSIDDFVKDSSIRYTISTSGGDVEVMYPLQYFFKYYFPDDANEAYFNSVDITELYVMEITADGHVNQNTYALKDIAIGSIHPIRTSSISESYYKKYKYELQLPMDISAEGLFVDLKVSYNGVTRDSSTGKLRELNQNSNIGVPLVNIGENPTDTVNESDGFNYTVNNYVDVYNYDNTDPAKSFNGGNVYIVYTLPRIVFA